MRENQKNFLIGKSVLPTFMSVWYLQKPEVLIGSSGTGVTNGCEPLSRYRELKSGRVASAFNY